jgi:hypothetical protein
MSSAEWEMQLEFVATVISELPEVGEDTYRIAAAIFSDKDDFATIFDYNDFGFRSVLLVSPHFLSNKDDVMSHQDGQLAKL